MPIVFIHGVNVRENQESYQQQVKQRNGFLRQIIAPALGLKPQALKILNPYWGHLGVKFAWEMAVLPRPKDAVEAFGAAHQQQALMAELLAEFPGLTGDLVKDARKDFPATVDLIYSAALSAAETEEDAQALARAYLQSSAYAETTPKPAWVKKKTTKHDNFVDLLEYHARQSGAGGGVEAFGAGTLILKKLWQKVASWFVRQAADVASDIAVRLMREKLNTPLTRFFGDAFVYLQQSEKQAAIVKVVLDALHQAAAARSADDDKLVVIAHSFGGEIMYDILTHFDPALAVDHLVTVGSQVGLFEEMKLYHASDPAVPVNPQVDRIPRPAGVKHWLNVYDTTDILSYRLEPVMDGVSDYFYNTGGHVLSAHGSYFKNARFYKRLGKRLQEG